MTCHHCRKRTATISDGLPFHHRWSIRAQFTLEFRIVRMRRNVGSSARGWGQFHGVARRRHQWWHVMNTCICVMCNIVYCVAVVACHVIMLSWLHKMSVKSLHITQAITQLKIAKNAWITQKYTSFKADFLTFCGPNYWFLKDLRNILLFWWVFNSEETKNSRTCDLIFRNFSGFWGNFLVFMGLK